MTDKRHGGAFHGLGCVLAALTLIGGGALHGVQAARAAAPVGPRINLAYLTTDQAFNAFDPSHAVAPPAVTHFPLGVQYVALYFSFKAALAGKTTFHVNFLSNDKALRRGETHPLSSADGTYLLDLPGTARLRPGEYQAAVYLGTHRAATTNFWIVTTPIVRTAYLIGSAAFAHFDAKHPAAPARSGPVKAGTKQVGVYVAYRAAVRGDTLAATVYDRYGRLAASVAARPLLHTPSGEVALLLSPTGGSYPAGVYRIDISMAGAVAASVPWQAR